MLLRKQVSLNDSNAYELKLAVSRLDLDATVEGHAAYIDAWLRVLRDDRGAIFTAARLAEEAFAFIVAREMPALGESTASAEDA